MSFKKMINFTQLTLSFKVLSKRSQSISKLTGQPPIVLVMDGWLTIIELR